MFTETDYDKLQQIMEESSEKKELLTRLLETHQTELSTISHEIRNPLTLVYSTLQLIESQHPEVHTFRHWDTMRQDLEYMKLLLEELSSYNNGSRITLATLHTSTFLKTAALSFAASLVETDIEFTSEIPEHLPEIQADTVKLRELLLNLLRNARDAVNDTTYDKHSHPSIILCTGIEDSLLVVSVTDNGCGIEPEKLQSIFTPFVTYKKDGTGLGLAVCSRIAKAHGGSLSVSSVPHVATTFTLRLPI